VKGAEATEDEWQLVERRLGLDRGWDVAYRLLGTLDHPGRPIYEP
jgi:hypothetical protein